jgi:hypothetical protein
VKVLLVKVTRGVCRDEVVSHSRLEEERDLADVEVVVEVEEQVKGRGRDGRLRVTFLNIRPNERGKSFLSLLVGFIFPDDITILDLILLHIAEDII